MASCPETSEPSLWRTMLVLGRVSNLLTVWSNCTAAWLLAGGNQWPRLPVVCAGGSLLYLGGMFLNDAFDARFDARFRPERPIAAGFIRVRTVVLIGSLLLGTGFLFFATLGQEPAMWGAGLAISIVLYDAVHKKTPLAPLLMAACRFLLYLAAAATAPAKITQPVLMFAGALAIYIVGVSWLARNESTGAAINYPALPLLFAPIAANLWVHRGLHTLLQGVILILFIVWILWCVRPLIAKKTMALRSAIPGLLAGIVLVDFLATQNSGTISFVFPLLFAGTLVLHRFVPAT